MVAHHRYRRSLHTSLHTSVDPSRFRAAVAAPTVLVRRYRFDSWTILRVEGVYREVVGRMSDDHLAHALTFAEVATVDLLDSLPAPGWPSRVVQDAPLALRAAAAAAPGSSR